MRIEKELMRGAAPLVVLKLLERGEMYGYELVEAVDRRSSGVLAMGESTLYPLLYNLEAKAYVESVWREADSGRSRKYYRLTRKGKARLTEGKAQWEALAHAMRAIGLATGAAPLPEGLP